LETDRNIGLSSTTFPGLTGSTVVAPELSAQYEDVIQLKPPLYPHS